MASKSSSRTLTDHEEIRRWAEERGAKPATVRSTHTDDDPGIIRLDFPGYSGAGSLEEISWDEWFEDFDDNNLALVVQDETANGQSSNFNKLVSRERSEEYSEKASGRSSKKKSASSSRTNSNQTSRAKATGSSRKKATGGRRETLASQKKKSAQGRNRSGGRRAA